MKYLFTFLLLIFTFFSGISQTYFVLSWSSHDVEYGGLVKLDTEYTGKFRVMYAIDDQITIVEQTVQIQSMEADGDLSEGFVIVCSNPVFANSTTPHTGYQPDNFYVTFNDLGEPEVVNIDGNGNTSMVELEELDSEEFLQYVLEELEWDGPKFRNIYFDNSCDCKVKVALRYLNENDVWTTYNWYMIDADKKTYLSYSGIKLLTSNAEIYVYAEIVDKDYSWTGDYTYTIDGKSYKMRKMTMTLEENGDYKFQLTCSNREK